MKPSKRKGTYTIAKMRPIVAAYANYTGTKKAYCAQHDLNPHTLDYWCKRIAAVDKPPKSSKQSSFIELAPFASSTSCYTLHFPDGKRLELPLQTPIDFLAQLIQISN